uniref:NADH-ubiquinone oxidoreductase chain 6 n=1 Tax=Trichophthalma punctata TaxID=395991 RepID=A1YAA4_9MUSC|nr:NADH dehydrogenase subunit 6 [Trichophthalma punctata]ABH03677.1 NADH dehydrogenase subunit 6 [Trichophthalma punctata]
MIQLMFLMYTLISSIIFLQINHPLAMGMMLLIQTVLISIITGLLSKSFWFSYVLFLIFMGGMLVLFIYVTSLASNEMFSMSMKIIMATTFITMMAMVIMYMLDMTMIIPMINNNEITEMLNITYSINSTSLNLNKLYNFPMNMLTMLLINYLLLTLIAIVKITNIYHGPLRTMN